MVLAMLIATTDAGTHLSKSSIYSLNIFFRTSIILRIHWNRSRTSILQYDITLLLTIYSRPWSSLWYCQEWSRYLKYGSPQARIDLQVYRTNYYGWYLGYLWFDRSRHSLS